MAEGDGTGSGWRTARAAAVALVIGLVAGPVVSNLFGWQVTRGTADEQLRDAVVEQQAMVCEAQARAEFQDTESLDWNARFALARKWP